MEDFWWADRFPWADPHTVDALGADRARRLKIVATSIDEGRRRGEEAAAKKAQTKRPATKTR